MLARVPAAPGLAPALDPGLTEHAHPVGSPAMLAFLAYTDALWLNRGLAAHPTTAFVSAGSGGGAEAALGGLRSFLLSHGMILVPGMPQVGRRRKAANSGISATASRLAKRSAKSSNCQISIRRRERQGRPTRAPV